MNHVAMFARYAEDIGAELRSAVPSEPAGLAGMLCYHLGWVDEQFRPAQTKSGKHLRPTICLLCCEGAGGQYRRALPAAAALELLHNFSLIHDDVEDRSYERRHRPTVWALWGEAQAINVGDAMYALAHQALYRLADLGYDAPMVLSAATAFERAALALTGGQYRDMSFERRAEVAMVEYTAMVAGKTAALLGCSAALGALLAGAAEDVVAAYGRFGEHLGLAFQIQDDILGIWGDPQVTGKPAADDVRSQKKCFPVVYAFESAPSPIAARLRTLYSLPCFTEEQVAEVVSLLGEAGARAQAEDLAAQWYRRALSELDTAHPLPGQREELRAVAEFLIGRSY